MAKTKKWAEQALVEQSFGHKDKNGNEVVKKMNVLFVCTSGMELFRKDFMEDKWKGEDRLVMPFDFLVEAGDMCPHGAFYEVEYQIEGNVRMCRALIQAVKPEDDLPLIIGTLKLRNLLPENMKVHRAWLRDDIDAVCVGMCTKDEQGETEFFHSHNEAKDGVLDDGERLSVAEYSEKHMGACLYYYRGDMREVWTCTLWSDRVKLEKVFVCGVNGNDPEFAQRKAEDMERLKYLMSDVLEIADDYQLRHLVVMENGEDSGKEKFHVWYNMDRQAAVGILQAMDQHLAKTEGNGNA